MVKALHQQEITWDCYRCFYWIDVLCRCCHNVAQNAWLTLKHQAFQNPLAHRIRNRRPDVQPKLSKVLRQVTSLLQHWRRPRTNGLRCSLNWIAQIQSNHLHLQPRTAEHVLQGDYISHTDSELGLLVLASAHHSHSRYTAKYSFPRIFLLSLDLDLSVFPCISPRILLSRSAFTPWSPYAFAQSGSRIQNASIFFLLPERLGIRI